MLHVHGNELIKTKKIKKELVENKCPFVSCMGFTAQDEWLDLNRSTYSHRKEGRICGYRYLLVDIYDRSLYKFSSCCLNLLS